MSRVAVTGAGGFVGRSLVGELSSREGYSVVAISRQQRGMEVGHVEARQWYELFEASDDDHPLCGCDCLVHLAGRAHVMDEASKSPEEVLDLYRQVNVANTLAVAERAADKGVRRFVYVSSIKVNGERSAPGRPIRAADIPAPEDAYGQSKYEAERALASFCRSTGMELTIVRPVLVYGPGVGANFERMMDWVAWGIPLPLASIVNARSFVSLENLVDLLIRCVDHPAAADQVFLVSDGDDFSTPTLLKNLATALGVKSRLIRFPMILLRFSAALLGRKTLADRLLDSLQVDIGPTCQALQWSPPATTERSLKITAEAWLLRKRKDMA